MQKPLKINQFITCDVDRIKCLGAPVNMHISSLYLRLPAGACMFIGYGMTVQLIHCQCSRSVRHCQVHSGVGGWFIWCGVTATEWCFHRWESDQKEADLCETGAEKHHWLCCNRHNSSQQVQESTGRIHSHRVCLSYLHLCVSSFKMWVLCMYVRLHSTSPYCLSCNWTTKSFKVQSLPNVAYVSHVTERMLFEFNSQGHRSLHSGMWLLAVHSVVLWHFPCFALQGWHVRPATVKFGVLVVPSLVHGCGIYAPSLLKSYSWREFLLNVISVRKAQSLVFETTGSCMSCVGKSTDCVCASRWEQYNHQSHALMHHRLQLTHPLILVPHTAICRGLTFSVSRGHNCPSAVIALSICLSLFGVLFYTVCCFLFSVLYAKIHVYFCVHSSVHVSFLLCAMSLKHDPLFIRHSIT